MIKTIIFDFDGTIADITKNFPSIVSVLNRFSDEFSYRKIKDEEIDKLRNKNMREIIKDLEIPLPKLPIVIRKIKSELNKQVRTWKSISGIKEVLLELKKKHTLGILTSNSKENVSTFLKNNDLDLFDFVYSDTSIFGKSKVIKKSLKNHDIKPERAIYVGDETRDIEACRKAGIKIIAVSWGLNSRKSLKRENPDFLIDKPKELLSVLNHLNLNLNNTNVCP